MYKWIFAVYMLATVSCTYLNPPVSGPKEVPREIQRAKSLIKEGLVKDAEAELQNFLTAGRDIQWHGEAYLTLANLYETQGGDAKAEEAYLHALKYGTHYHSIVSSQALYRLSWLYERNKRYQDMLLVLLDLIKNPGLSDNYVIQTEAPARVANAYYVLGQWDKANEYRAKVSVIPAQKGGDVTPYPSLVYKNFANLPLTLNENFERHMERVGITQKDLLEVGEMGDAELAKKALNHIREDYETLFVHLTQKVSGANPVEIHQKEKVRLTQLAQVMDLLQLLKSYRRPAEVINNSELNNRFFSDFSKQEKQIQRTVRNLRLGVEPANRGKNPNEAPEKIIKTKIKGAHE